LIAIVSSFSITNPSQACTCTPLTSLVRFSDALYAIPYFAALGDEIIIWIDHQKSGDVRFNLQICHVLPSYAFPETSFAGAVNVAALFLTNSWTVSGSFPVSI
jgi:hypothetical protein